MNTLIALAACIAVLLWFVLMALHSVNRNLMYFLERFEKVNKNENGSQLE